MRALPWLAGLLAFVATMACIGYMDWGRIVIVSSSASLLVAAVVFHLTKAAIARRGRA